MPTPSLADADAPIFYRDIGSLSLYEGIFNGQPVVNEVFADYHDENCGYPTMSPDGRTVAFYCFNDSTIVVGDTVADTIIRKWPAPGALWSLNFHPDGGSLLFQNFDSVAQEHSIERFDLGTGDTEPIIEAEVPLWDSISSADGAYIVYLRDDEDVKIEIASANGTHLRTIELPGTYAAYPAMSPDNTLITYAGVDQSWAPPSPESPCWEDPELAECEEVEIEEPIEIFTYNLLTDEVEQLTTTGGTRPYWSADGTKIYYSEADAWWTSEQQPGFNWITPDGNSRDHFLSTTEHQPEYAPKPPSALVDLLNDLKPVWKFDSGENFFPQKVEAFTDNWYPDENDDYAVDDDLVNRLVDGNGQTLAAAGSPETVGLPPRLAAGVLSANYTFGPNAASQESDYIDARGNDQNTYLADAGAQVGYGNGPAMYGRVVRDPDDGALWLQYWLFYYYNSFSEVGLGTHEGDWEMMQVRIEDGEPDAVTFAAHNIAAGCDWSEVEKSGDNPIAYIAAKSHAAYPHSGTTDLLLGSEDHHFGSGLAATYPLQLMSGPWTGWHGRWGSRVSGPFKSPVNPSEQGDKWDHPSTFHSDHDDSDEC